MARTDRSKPVAHEAARKYRDTARTFLAAGQALHDLADENESYGNAIALLAVHAAIACADAITIAYGERKSTSGDHEQTVALLTQILGARLPEVEKKRLRRLAALKDTVAYQGKYFPLDEARRHHEDAHAFARWAEEMYQTRPA